MGRVHEVKTDAAGYEAVTDDEFVTESEDESRTPTALQTGASKWGVSPAWLSKRFSTLWTVFLARGRKLVLIAGHLAWIFTTSMLLVGLPILYAYDREKNAQLQEQPMLAMSQQS